MESRASSHRLDSHSLSKFCPVTSVPFTVGTSSPFPAAFLSGSGLQWAQRGEESTWLRRLSTSSSPPGSPAAGHQSHLSGCSHVPGLCLVLWWAWAQVPSLTFCTVQSCSPGPGSSSSGDGAAQPCPPSNRSWKQQMHLAGPDLTAVTGHHPGNTHAPHGASETRLSYLWGFFPGSVGSSPRSECGYSNPSHPQALPPPSGLPRQGVVWRGGLFNPLNI